MIDLRRLRAFVALAEEGHVTRAAERLSMQQPPLTRLLRGLETELGVLLMHRLPRGVRPTEAGKALLAEARDILARADQLPGIVARAARGEAGSLAIGFTSSAAFHAIVPATLRRFREHFPSVAVTLEEAGTAELVDGLMTERLDAAFVRSPVSHIGDLDVLPVIDEPMLAAIPAGHRLAGATIVDLAELAGEPLILYRRASGPGLHDAIVAACRGLGFSPIVAQEAPRLPATLSLVAAGLGITIVPASMQRLGGDDIVYRPLGPAGVLSAPIDLASRRARPSPALGQFRKMVSDAASRP
jgi:DNA-binding transcriptional LysR family regulator